MTRVAPVPAPVAAHPFAPRVVRLRVLLGPKRRRTVDTADPDALLREMVLVAVDRFEAARRFHELAIRQARAMSSSEVAPAWEILVFRAEWDVAEMEAALAYLIETTFNALAPPALRVTPEEEAQRDRTAPYGHRFIRRGFEVQGIAFLLTDDPGNMRPGLVARIPADRALTI